MYDGLPSQRIIEEARMERYANFNCDAGGSPGVAKCTDGNELVIGQHVTINENTDIEEYIYGKGKAKVFDVFLTRTGSGSPYNYEIIVDGTGPDTGWWTTTTFKLEFKDREGDRYDLSLYRSKRLSHVVRFNSSDYPIIEIKWKIS